MNDAPGLRLRAETADDLQTFSAALQDSVFKIGDLRFDAKARRFSALVNRFRWEAAGRKGPYQRVRAALSIEGVLAVKTAHVQRGDRGAVAALLDLAFDAEKEPPAGVLRLVLAGGGEIRLDVECVDALLIDVGPAWPTARKPFHGQL
jgi:hypothetical protein